MVNGGELELRDAILIDRVGKTELRERWLGTIAAGAAVEIDGPRRGRSRRNASTRARVPTPTRSWRSRERTGKPARKTRESFAWSPGRPGRHGGQVIDPPSIGTGASPRSSSTCAAGAPRAPTAGDTTGWPPSDAEVQARYLEEIQSHGAAGRPKPGQHKELPPSTAAAGRARPSQTDDQSRPTAQDGVR